MYLLMQIPRGEGDVGKGEGGGGGGCYGKCQQGVGIWQFLKLFLSSSSVFKNTVNTSGITNLI